MWATAEALPRRTPSGGAYMVSALTFHQTPISRLQCQVMRLNQETPARTKVPSLRDGLRELREVVQELRIDGSLERQVCCGDLVVALPGCPHLLGAF